MLGLAEIALLYLPMNIPYVWGGNDVTIGVDCSGFVCEISRAVGILGKEDLNAQGLYDKFWKQGKTSGIFKDSLLFFGKDLNSISHVAIAINSEQMIEAGGEGREGTDKGYVRIRPVKNRKDLLAAFTL